VVSDEAHPLQPDPTLVQRVWGGVLVIGATAVVTLLEIFFVPFVIGTHHVPVSLVLLVASSPVLCALARWALGHPLGSLLPLPVWFVLSALGNYKTATGDLLIAAGNWVASTYVLLGLVVWLVSIVLALRGELLGPRHAPAGAPASRTSAGSRR